MPYNQYPNVPAANLTILLLKLALVKLMMAGNYWGRSLTLKDKI